MIKLSVINQKEIGLVCWLRFALFILEIFTEIFGFGTEIIVVYRTFEKWAPDHKATLIIFKGVFSCN